MGAILPFIDGCLSSINTTAMPSSDYKDAIGGGLKLKGAKDGGVDKKKKKKKPKTDSHAENTKAVVKSTQEAENDDRGDDSAVQKALADEEDVENQPILKQREDEVKEYGKTEAQRRHEERRRKRVSARSRCRIICDMALY